MADCTLTTMVSTLQENGLPTAQMQWYPQKAPAFPYCTLTPQGTDNIFADNIVRHSPVSYELEVFTETRDIPLEKRIQALLESMGIAWQRDNYVTNGGVVASYQITLIEE